MTGCGWCGVGPEDECLMVCPSRGRVLSGTEGGRMSEGIVIAVFAAVFGGLFWLVWQIRNQPLTPWCDDRTDDGLW